MPPKKPYAFDEMLINVLDFACLMLVDNGRLSMWMPAANDEDVELAIPTHPGLDIVSVCVQQFNKCRGGRWEECRQVADHSQGREDYSRTRSVLDLIPVASPHVLRVVS